MSNEHEDIKHFVANNDKETIARVWAKEIIALKNLVKSLEDDIQSLHEEAAGEDI